MTCKPNINKSWLTFNCCGLWLILSVSTITGYAVEQERPVEYEDNEVHMRLVIRTKEQLSAFYHGREFQQNAIDEILKTCFITPLIRNKTFDALWVEADSWAFSRDKKTIPRYKRDYWKKVWKDVGLSLAHQSTFGWTLMPETRDLRIDEGVGGSIAIPMQIKPFTLKARFNTGLIKDGKPKIIEFKDISCAN